MKHADQCNFAAQEKFCDLDNLILKFGSYVSEVPPGYLLLVSVRNMLLTPKIENCILKLGRGGGGYKFWGGLQGVIRGVLNKINMAVSFFKTQVGELPSIYQ